jgi:hypothetical protein
MLVSRTSGRESAASRDARISNFVDADRCVERHMQRPRMLVRECLVGPVEVVR